MRCSVISKPFAIVLLLAAHAYGQINNPTANAVDNGGVNLTSGNIPVATGAHTLGNSCCLTQATSEFDFSFGDRDWVVTNTSGDTLTMENGVGVTVNQCIFAQPSDAAMNCTGPIILSSFVQMNGIQDSASSAHQVPIAEGSSNFTYKTLTDGQLLVGVTGADPSPQTMSGDCTLANTGAVTCTKSSGNNIVTGTTQSNRLSMGSATTNGVQVLANSQGVLVHSSTSNAAPTWNNPPSNVPLAWNSSTTSFVASTVTSYGAPVFSFVASLSLSATDYIPVGISGWSSTTETSADVNLPESGAMSNLYVQLSSDPGNGNTVTITFRDAAAGTLLTCTITGNGSTGTNCSNLINNAAPTAGDLVDWQITQTGTIVATPNITISAKFLSNN